MPNLMLQAAGEEAVALNGDGVAMFVGAGDPRPVSTPGGEGFTWDGEAAFVIVVIGHAGGDGGGFQDRVDHAAATHGATLCINVFLGFLGSLWPINVWAVVDEKTFPHTDLVRGEANTVGRIHCLVHVGDQLGKLGGAFRHR